MVDRRARKLGKLTRLIAPFLALGWVGCDRQAQTTPPLAARVEPPTASTLPPMTIPATMPPPEMTRRAAPPAPGPVSPGPALPAPAPVRTPL